LTITTKKLERLAGQMREVLRAGPVEFRRAYLRMFVHRVVVSRREVRISGPRSALAKAAGSEVPLPGPEVLSFVREWRPVRDSNPCYQRESWEVSPSGTSESDAPNLPRPVGYLRSPLPCWGAGTRSCCHAIHWRMPLLSK
jgi:hypothetical protein